MFSRYSFEDLKAKALAPNATEDDVDRLGDWFESFGQHFWNGECYDIDGDHGLFPVYEQNGEDLDLVGYEVR